MSELALQLIAENKRTKNPFLNLGNCGLENYVPEEILECTWLQGLNLGVYYYDSVQKKWIESKNRGRDNKFNGTELKFLEKLTQLQALHISETQITDIRFLEKLSQLQILDLSETLITDISSLEKLTQLQILNLSYNQITDYSSLKKLTQLQLLNLSTITKPITDISFLEKLTQLQTLYLRNNRITDIRFLEKLTQLQTLDLSDDQITDVSFLEKLTQLQTLTLKNNQITDIRFLEKLSQIKTLDLRNNKITDIQFLIPHLKRGLELDFTSDYYWELNNKIGLKGNPVTNPPQEIIKQGNEAIIEYFEEGNKKRLNECKLIFVGDGGVGKTSLMRRVVYNEFNDEESTTHGINKIAWKELRNEFDELIKVNLWDFGGQHIQHSLHQFFFTERVVYVLVLNPRNDQKAHYWLEQIEKLGKESEVLVVYNWRQEEDKEAPYLNNFYELRKKYPKLPEPYLLSCLTGEGIDTFKQDLATVILKNKGLKDGYKEDWFNIKTKLEQEVSVGNSYVTYDTYQKWCNELKYTIPARQKNLLKILDSIGSIVFIDKPILNQLQVLNPDWVTTGAYSILVAEQTKNKKGHLGWDDLKEIFSEEKEIFANKQIKIKYEEQHFPFILELMSQYNLCEKNPFRQHEYLIPSALGEKPEKDYESVKVNARNYRLQFDSPFEMLIIHRFIAKNLTKLTGKDYWQSGIYIKHPGSKTFALVETNLYSERIDCWIKGENIRGFWEMIRADFKEILEIYHNFKVTEEVLYQKDGKEVFLPYEEMLKSLRNGVRIIPYHPTYEIYNINVLEVIELFEDSHQILRTMENNEKIHVEVKPEINVNPVISPEIIQNNNPPEKQEEKNPPKKEESEEGKKLKALEKTIEDKAVKSWKNFALISLIVSLVITGIIIIVYAKESEFIMPKERWESFKKGEIFKWGGLVLAFLWNSFIGKMLYDRFFDDSKEKAFRENLKNKK